MKNRIIILIGSLTGIALLILLIMQFYWINISVKIKETNFESNVANAIENVIFKIEKIELSKRIEKIISEDKGDSIPFKSLDSIESFLNNETNISSDKFNELIRDIFRDRKDFYNYKLIENKITVNKLDSLIGSELREKDIHSEYEFGIYSPQRQMLVLQKTGNYTSELMNKSLKFKLNPLDIYSPTEYIYIYFPKHGNIIFAQLWGIFLISAILIALLVMIFTITISTLKKQKKLTDLRSDLINNLTHEFKTPISTISLACEALSDPDLEKSSGMYSSYVNVIKEENRRLGVMAENVLQAAIIEKGQYRLNKTELKMHDLINGVIKNISLQSDKNMGIIDIDFAAKNDLIEVDKEHISGVIFNLLDNAFKYSGTNPKIKIKTENTEHGMIITIADNGIGISKLNQKKIFDTLYRVPTGNIHNIKGYGLGLGYVKAIVEKHGGNISVESELKKGSIFRILLPYA